MARPREFDEKMVLDRITALFWEKGFESTSLDDIMRATGLRKGSLYSCFGNKEKLFRIALNHYAEKGPFYPFRNLQSPLKKLSAFYSALIDEALEKEGSRKGCFVFNSCLEFAGKKSGLSLFVSKVGNRNEVFFHALIKEAKGKDEMKSPLSAKTAGNRAHATAFTIREMSKFKPDKVFLKDIANSFFESVGAKERVLHGRFDYDHGRGPLFDPHMPRKLR